MWRPWDSPAYKPRIQRPGDLLEGSQSPCCHHDFGLPASCLLPTPPVWAVLLGQLRDTGTTPPASLSSLCGLQEGKPTES